MVPEEEVASEEGRCDGDGGLDRNEEIHIFWILLSLSLSLFFNFVEQILK